MSSVTSRAQHIKRGFEQILDLLTKHFLMMPWLLTRGSRARLSGATGVSELSEVSEVSDTSRKEVTDDRRSFQLRDQDIADESELICNHSNYISKC